MGLDMYLHTNSRAITRAVHEKEPYGEYITDFYRTEGICLYWRKANAIHRWFVEHVQDGNDDCDTYEVTVEQLQELRDLCQKVTDDHALAPSLLPTTGGFFFGSTDYDDWYFDDVSWTAKQLGIILGMLVKKKSKTYWEYHVTEEEPDWKVKFWYHSSW